MNIIKTAFCLILLAKCALTSDDLQKLQGDNYTKLHEAEVKLKNELLKNYSVDVLPPHNSTYPVMVKMGVSLILIKDLDTKTQTSEVQLWMKLIWEDSRLGWNASDYAGIDVLRINARRLWHPDLYLYNSENANHELNEQIQVVLPHLTYPDGDVVWIPAASVHSLCEMNLKYYPYDTHTCTWKFGSWTHDGDHIDLQLYNNQEYIGLSDVWPEGGNWEIVTTKALKNIQSYSCCNGSYPDLTFSVTLRRRSPFYKSTIECPIIASTILILISFWISPLILHRLVLNLVSLFTSIALLMHLTSILPAVGKEIPIIMSTCGVLLMTSFLALVSSVAAKTIVASKKNDQLPGWMTKVIENRFVGSVIINTYKQVEKPKSCGDSVNLVTDDDQQSRSAIVPNKASWLSFFQVIDRVFFVVFLIINISSIVSLPKNNGVVHDLSHMYNAK